MRWTGSGRKTCGAAAYGQAVWSCPLDAGVKLIEVIDKRRWLPSPTHRGERGAAEKNHRAGNAGAFRPTLSDYARMLFVFRIRGCGCGQRPAFPAPSVWRGTRIAHHPDANRAAGML